jgi:hypothetical protein
LKGKKMPRRIDMSLTPNQKENEFNLYSPVVINYAVTNDHSTDKAAFVAPFPMRILDIIVKANATQGSGTLVPKKGTDAMCTAIACAADGTVSRLAAGALFANDARLTLATGDTVNIQSVGGTAANTRGFVTFVGVRV